MTELGTVADSAKILDPQLSSYVSDAGNHVTISVPRRRLGVRARPGVYHNRMIIPLFQSNPAAAVALLLGLVVGVVVHEAAHAYSAYLLGDDTAYRAGRVTLNPASHLDLLGSMMFLMAGFGWGKPTPVTTSKLRGGVLGPVAVAAAGPALEPPDRRRLRRAVPAAAFPGTDTSSSSSCARRTATRCCSCST